MLFSTFVVSTLSSFLLALPQADSAAPLPSSCANKAPFHPIDCTTYTLDEFPSDGIENHLVIGNESNMPEGLLEFEGLFYLNGNGIDDEVSTFANMKLDESTGEFVGKVYDAGLFGFNSNLGGKLLYQFVRTFGLHYRVNQTAPGRWHVTPQFYIPQFLNNPARQLEVKDAISEFEIVKTDDPNVYSRVSHFFGKEIPPYRFVRIVYGNGTRTERYAAEYLPNIDSHKPKVTLSKTQLVARAIDRA